MPAPRSSDPATPRPPRRRPGRRRLLVLLALLAASAAALAGATAATTRLQTLDGAESAARERPAWAAPCFWRPPRPDRRLLARCARATGIVVRIRAQGPDGKDEVHFAVVGRFGALVVKLGDPRRLPTPSLGSRVTAVGPLVRASNGMREIQAWSLR